MNSKRNKILIFLLLINQIFFAQVSSEHLEIVVRLKFDNQAFELDKNYVSAQKDTLSFETVKFYLSDFQLIYKDKSVKKENNSYHLLDFENIETCTFQIANEREKEIEAIRFAIGVDSLASVSGAMEGDLDATNGMYWAWQSGFINMKIEGKSNSCKTRKNKFHFHIGGYLEPNYAMRTIQINCNGNSKNQLILEMDLGKLFSEISLKETNSIMIPGAEAMKIADLYSKIFSIE
uniref:MbnP family protein n=1 Tax=Flavobacterium sp. TaxID=239 RepID=UPI004048EECA